MLCRPSKALRMDQSKSNMTTELTDCDVHTRPVSPLCHLLRLAINYGQKFGPQVSTVCSLYSATKRLSAATCRTFYEFSDRRATVRSCVTTPKRQSGLHSTASKPSGHLPASSNEKIAT